MPAPTLRSALYVCVLTACFAGCQRAAPDVDELGSKSEYSILQALEYEWRGKVVSAPQIRAVSGYEVVGLPSLDGQSTVWVMLRPKANPLYKVSSAEDFTIAKELVDSLVREGRISGQVHAALLTHVRED